LNESNALLWIILLHTHELRLHAGAVADSNGIPVTLPPLTQRQAAEVVADVWAESMPQKDERADYRWWYRQYSCQTPYEVLGDVPETLQPRLFALRDALLQDPRVEAVVVEE
jgi:hypothetical protein